MSCHNNRYSGIKLFLHDIQLFLPHILSRAIDTHNPKLTEIQIFILQVITVYQFMSLVGFRFSKLVSTIKCSIIMICPDIHNRHIFIQFSILFLKNFHILRTVVIHHISTENDAIIFPIIQKFHNLRPQFPGMHAIFCYRQSFVTFQNCRNKFFCNILTCLGIGHHMQITDPGNTVFLGKIRYFHNDLLYLKWVFRCRVVLGRFLRFRFFFCNIIRNVLFFRYILFFHYHRFLFCFSTKLQDHKNNKNG